MKEVRGDIWDFHKQGHWVVITTNGTAKKDGSAVMGRGVALQAKQRCPNLPLMLGSAIKKERNRVFVFTIKEKIISFPVKNHWMERANLNLIETSCKQLAEAVGKMPMFFKNSFDIDVDVSYVYLPRPGCGNGRLDWKDVKPILEKYLDNRFIVVEKGGK